MPPPTRRNQGTVLKNYLVPNPKDKELVIFADTPVNAAVVASQSTTSVLSGEAAAILRSALLGSEKVARGRLAPAKLDVIVPSVVSSEQARVSAASAWLRDSADDGLFQLAAAAPRIDVRSVTTVRAGSVIATATVGEGRGVPAEYAGTLIKALVNRTQVFWYAADVSLKDKLAMLEVDYPAGVTAGGPQAASIYPRPAPLRLGANCNVCTVCGGCGACGACGLCGGVDFGAAALALVAVDATLTAVNAAAAFGVLRKA